MEHALASPHPGMMAPFVLLLSAIALGPLFFAEWWSRHYPKVALALAAVTLCYYLFELQNYERVWHTTREYVSFIALIGSLFVVAGGIHISVKGEATPLANVVFLAVGAVIANLLGTTGAAMLLIRPWLRMNKYRVTRHHVVFFIFIICNVGGCLTPIGDPPLFLGYLKGVPFWWVAEHCWPIWAVGVGCLLAMFLVIDRWNYTRAPAPVRASLAETPDEWRFEGLQNIGFLAVILGAVFISDPPFLREVLMLGAAAGSYYATPKAVHEANRFNFHPVREVAILFVGIFATMLPALDWLQVNSSRMAEPGAAFFFWGTGLLSSVLDNAPTYLSFFQAMAGAFVPPDLIAQIQQLLHNGDNGPAAATEAARGAVAALAKYFPEAFQAKTVDTQQIQIACLLGNESLNRYLVAVSVGSVFFGANTYIGNGPNFMVKSIADHQKVHTPGFLGYIVQFTVPFMLPMLLLVGLLFFR